MSAAIIMSLTKLYPAPLIAWNRGMFIANEPTTDLKTEGVVSLKSACDTRLLTVDKHSALSDADWTANHLFFMSVSVPHTSLKK